MKVDIKTKAELAQMREACRMSAEIRDICAAAVAPGVTTGEIDDLVVEYCRKHNVGASFFEYPGGRHAPDFPGHLCVSLNDEVIHGIPDRNRVIMPGDLVKTDVGIKKNGFNGDTSRTVALGVTDPEVLRLVDVPDEVIHDRIAGRRTCPKCKAGYHVKALPPKVEGICDKCGAELVIRKDDNPETVKDRLVVYHRETEPLIKYYEEKGLLRRIDGDQGPEKNAAAFLAAM